MTIELCFKHQHPDFTLDVKLSLPLKGVTAIYGPSGSGKTTLLRLIAGLDYCADGLLKVGDDHWQKPNSFLASYKRPLAYVFQEASLFEHLTVQGNIEFGYKRIRLLERNILLDQVIALLRLEQLLQRKPAQLSGGERQRVAIARALAVSPKLLLMDEPLASLDVNHKRELLPYLESLVHDLNIPIIYVSHAPEEVVRLADQLVLLENGKVLSSGFTGDLMSRLDSPLAHGQDAATLVEGQVVEHDAQYHLTYLDTALGRMSIVGNSLSIGKKLKLQIAARDISLTLHAQCDTSILNIFPAVIDQIIDEDVGQVMVRLLAGGVPILARLTLKSSAQLGLKPGKKVFAQAKSIAVLY